MTNSASARQSQAWLGAWWLSAFLLCICSQPYGCRCETTVVVSSVKELRIALANPAVSVIRLPALLDLQLTHREWPPDNVVRLSGRSVVIEGGTVAADSFPVLDLNYLPNRISLEAANLTFRNMFQLNLRLVNPQAFPGLDLIKPRTPPPSDPSQAPVSVVSTQNVYFIQRAGGENAFYVDPRSYNIRQALRPAIFSGSQISQVPEPAETPPCRKASRLYAAQCWPLTKMLHVISFARTSMDAVSGQPTGYFIEYERSHFLRLITAPMSCVESKGIDNCVNEYNAMVADKPLMQPAIVLPTQKPDRGSKARDIALHIVLPCVLGTITLVVSLVLILRYKKRKRQQASSKSADYTVVDHQPPITATLRVEITKRSSDGIQTPAIVDVRMLDQQPTLVDEDELYDIDMSPLKTGLSGPMASNTGSTPVSTPLLWACSHGLIPSDSRLCNDILATLVLGDDVQLVEPPRVLGQGWYGQVLEGTYCGQPVAIKQLHAAMATCESAVKALTQEVEVLGRVNNRNIVRYLGAGLSSPNPFLVTELMGSSLKDLLYSSSSSSSSSSSPGQQLLPLDKVLSIATDIATGLAYLHPFIIHRDLKPDNVLLDLEGTAKISDFGLARVTASSLCTEHPEFGTAPYTAPECFDKAFSSISWHADIFSLGVLISEMLMGRRPWSGMEPMQIAVAVTVHNLRPSLPDDEARCPAPLRKLLLACWAKHPKRRPSAVEVAKKLMVIGKQVSAPQVEVSL